MARTLPVKHLLFTETPSVHREAPLPINRRQILLWQ
jgi:hypothetical protein